MYLKFRTSTRNFFAIQSETFCVTCSTAGIAPILSFVFFWQKTKNHTKKAKFYGSALKFRDHIKMIIRREISERIL